MNWFECKVIYEKPVENSAAMKKTPELYLVDALSFTEAEARIIEEMTPFITGSFEVANIKRAKYNELFFSDEETADRWFKCKVYYIIPDEKTGKEKKTPNNFLVQSSDLKDAVKKLEDGLKGTMIDYTISSVTETTIMDVYPFKVPEKPEFQQ